MTDRPLVLRQGNEWSERRIAAGLSMRQLALASGVSRGLISLIERGRYTPTASEAQRLLAALPDREDAA